MVDKAESLSLRNLSSTRPTPYQATRSTLQPLAEIPQPNRIMTWVSSLSDGQASVGKESLGHRESDCSYSLGLRWV